MLPSAWPPIWQQLCRASHKYRVVPPKKGSFLLEPLNNWIIIIQTLRKRQRTYCTLGNDRTPWRTAGSQRMADDGEIGSTGTEREEGGAWGCFFRISWRISGDGEARPSDVRAWWSCCTGRPCAARLALLKFLVEVGADERDCLLARDWASSRASDQRETKSPSAQRWRLDFTRFMIPCQRKPLACSRTLAT